MEPIELGLLVVIMLGPVVLAWYAYRWAYGDERSRRVQSNINGSGGEGGAGSDGEIAGFDGGGGGGGGGGE